MSELATDAGRDYLEALYQKSGVALAGAIQVVRGNQFEVSRLIGEVLAAHDTQDALLWRMVIRKTGANTAALDKMITPAIDLLRNIRSQVLILGIDSEVQGQIEYALGSVHGGADGQMKELNLDTVE